MRIQRRPAVAGSFYEQTPERLKQQIQACYLHTLGPGSLPKVKSVYRRKTVGVLVPHAGYMYSGPVACHAYAALAADGKPDTAVIIGPNHTGMGSGVSIQSEGEWLTPIGKAELDSEIAHSIMSRTKLLEEDAVSQEHEHSVEVQVPMLQYLYGDKVKIVPIVIMLQYVDVCRELADAIAFVIKSKNAVVIASSDLTHYEPATAAHEKDKRALSNVERVDGEGLMETVERFNISMCGPAPAATMLMVSKRLAAASGQILKYSTSGDITGDNQAVVGYGAAKISMK